MTIALTRICEVNGDMVTEYFDLNIPSCRMHALRVWRYASIRTDVKVVAS